MMDVDRADQWLVMLLLMALAEVERGAQVDEAVLGFCDFEL